MNNNTDLTNGIPPMSEPNPAVPETPPPFLQAPDVSLPAPTLLVSTPAVPPASVTTWGDVFGGLFVLLMVASLVGLGGFFLGTWVERREDRSDDDKMRRKEIVRIHLVADPNQAKSRRCVLKTGEDGRPEAWIILDNPEEAERLRCFLLTECWKKDAIGHFRFGKADQEKKDRAAARVPGRDPFWPPVVDPVVPPVAVERDALGAVIIPVPWPGGEKGMAILRALQEEDKQEERERKEKALKKEVLDLLLAEPLDAPEWMAPAGVNPCRPQQPRRRP